MVHWVAFQTPAAGRQEEPPIECKAGLWQRTPILQRLVIAKTMLAILGCGSGPSLKVLLCVRNQWVGGPSRPALSPLRHVRLPRPEKTEPDKTPRVSLPEAPEAPEASGA